MSDTSDDMECEAGGLFCRNCKEHYENCECYKCDDCEEPLNDNEESIEVKYGFI